MTGQRLLPAEGPFLEQVLDASYPLWNEGLSRAAYGRWWDAQLLTRWGREHLHRYVLAESDRAVASAKRYDFDATLDGRPARVMGIGAVFTPLEERHAGRARQLIELMIDEGAHQGFEFALLFSEIDPAYYTRLGFEAIDLRDVRVELSPKTGAPATLVRAGDDRDLPAIASIDAASARPFRFHLNRSVALIQYALTKRRLLAGLGPHGARELLFFVAEEGSAAVAYLVVTVTDGVWTIEECGDRDPAAARVGAMLQVLLAREPATARPRIHGWLPPDFAPPQIRALSDQPVAETMMMRALGTTPLPKLSQSDVRYWHADLF